MANNYDINYDDERFVQVESDKNEALSQLEQTYGGMIEESNDYYQAQIKAADDYAQKQSQIQQENTDFAIEKIEQQKAQANKDYKKEQAGAYTDWQKQSNKYGVNAEQMAAGGLTNTGFSESSQVSMYNTYQNRVSVARESYNKAVLDYDNAIKDATLQNNSKLAEIAYQALQTKLELSLQGFQYRNSLLLEQANRRQELENTYYGRYQDVLNQMNTENALAEQIRQYNEEIARLKKKDEEEAQYKAQMLELEKQQLEQAKYEWEQEFALAQQKSSGGGGGGSYKRSSGGGGSNDPAIKAPDNTPTSAGPDYNALLRAAAATQPANQAFNTLAVADPKSIDLPGTQKVGMGAVKSAWR